MWQGEQDTLEPCDVETATMLYEEELSEHEVDYAEAFPEVTTEDA